MDTLVGFVPPNVTDELRRREVARVTEKWKVSFNAQNEYRASRFTLSDGTERRFFLRGADASARASTGFSEFRNTQASGALDLSAEYNVFPWNRATSRQVLAIVAVGSRTSDYYERSIFGLTAEHRPLARLVLAGKSRQV